MTKEEYKLSLLKIEAEKDKKVKELREIYAFSNNKVATGDIFTDHIGSIKVETIKLTMGRYDGFPECVYFGTMLKKDLTQFKSGEKRNAWQSNAV